MGTRRRAHSALQQTRSNSMRNVARGGWESGRGDTAEEAHLKALAVGRTRLGDGHPVAKKALAAMLDLKQKQRGGGSSP